MSMKKAAKRMTLVVMVFALFTAFNKVRFHYDWSEALKRTAMTPFVGTLWADGFSELNFSKVRIGMSEIEVRTLLGVPLQKWVGTEGYTWLYSWQDTPTADYERRWVSFDSKGLVDEVIHEFYID